MKPAQQDSRLRWLIARRLDRRPTQCWSDLVMWALNWFPEETPLWRPSRPVTETCRADAARTGACYCAKLQQTADGTVATFVDRDAAGRNLRGET